MGFEIQDFYDWLEASPGRRFRCEPLWPKEDDDGPLDEPVLAVWWCSIGVPWEEYNEARAGASRWFQAKGRSAEQAIETAWCMVAASS